MALKPAICTQCGGQIQVDDSKEAGICPNCGTAFITEKVINQFVTQNNFAGATFNVQGGPDIKNLITLARRAADSKNREDAFRYYGQVRELDPNNAEAEFFYSIINGDKFSNTVKRTFSLLIKNGEDNDEENFHIYGNIESLLSQDKDFVFLISDNYKEYWDQNGEGEPFKVSVDLFNWFTANKGNLEYIEIVRCLIYGVRMANGYNDRYYECLKVLKNDERYVEDIAKAYKSFMSLSYNTDTAGLFFWLKREALADEDTKKKFKLNDNKWRIFDEVEIPESEFNNMVALVKKYNPDFSFYTYDEIQRYIKYFRKRKKVHDRNDSLRDIGKVLLKLALVCLLVLLLIHGCRSCVVKIFSY